MKHIILDNQNNVNLIGENYTQVLDEYATKVYGKETMCHSLNGILFDIHFLHTTVETVPQEVIDNPSFFKFENGTFRRRIDLQRQIEENLILTLIEEGTL